MLSLRSDQREHTRVESYTVTMTANDKERTYHPDSLEEFKQFQTGTQWKIKLNLLGSVTSAEPAN